MRILIALAFALTSVIAPAENPVGTIQMSRDQLPWRPGPSTMPPGLETAVLEGDPRQPGLFTMRLRAPAGTRLAPHTHSQAERVTVLAGVIGIGFGSTYDPTRLKVFRAGDYYVNPAGAPHYVGFAQDTVVQITGQGPWTLDFLAH